MKLSWLEALIAVIDGGTFSEAALRLDMSQAAVSYAVAELERELGGKVFERGRFGARPTQLGLRVADHARQVLQLVDSISQEASLEARQLSGTLRIAAYRSVASYLLPVILTELRRRHPALRPTLVEVSGEGAARQALNEHRAEIGFLEYPDNGEFLSWQLFSDPFVAVVPARGEPPESWRAVYRHPFIGYADDGCSLYVNRYLAELDEPIVPSHLVSEDSTILSMVAQGLGASLVPELVIDHLPDGVVCLPLERPLQREIGVAILGEGLRQPAVRAFLGVVRDLYPDSGIPEFAQPLSVAAPT